MPDRIYQVEQLSDPIRRAWASTNTCNAVPECSEPPTHKIWIRAKRKMRRWREDFQNDFAARMEWTTKPYRETNHPPIVVLGENTPAEFTVHSGQEFHLNATGSYDPDHDSISYYWFQYVEAGDLAEPINITQFSQVPADFPVRAPKVDHQRRSPLSAASLTEALPLLPGIAG